MNNQIILYNNESGQVKVNVFFQEESFWLTQKAMAELFGVEVPAVNKHLNNIFKSGELVKDRTISIMETVQKEGNPRLTTTTKGWSSLTRPRKSIL